MGRFTSSCKNILSRLAHPHHHSDYTLPAQQTQVVWEQSPKASQVVKINYAAENFRNVQSLLIKQMNELESDKAEVDAYQAHWENIRRGYPNYQLDIKRLNDLNVEKQTIINQYNDILSKSQPPEKILSSDINKLSKMIKSFMYEVENVSKQSIVNHTITEETRQKLIADTSIYADELFKTYSNTLDVMKAVFTNMKEHLIYGSTDRAERMINEWKSERIGTTSYGMDELFRILKKELEANLNVLNCLQTIQPVTPPVGNSERSAQQAEIPTRRFG